MREAGTEIRKAIFNALDGVVMYDGKPVGIFDGKYEGIANIADGVWIIFGEQTSTDRSNKHQFASEETVELIIANKTASAAGKEIVEQVSDDVLDILLPTPQTEGITVSAPFQLVFMKKTDGRASQVAQNVSMMFNNTKTLNFLTRITQ